MKKSLVRVFLVSVCVLALAISAAHATHSYEGSIWVGKPTILGTGYYCTAAQNRSGGDVTTHWAKAKTWKTSGGTPVSATASGNNRAVASTNTTKPYKGWGSYGETGWSTEGNFSSSAWD